MSHVCPTHLCETVIEHDTILMCRKHWYELPYADREAIYDSYSKTGGGPEHLRNIAPILERQKNRLYPPRNQGKPFGL